MDLMDFIVKNKGVDNIETTPKTEGEDDDEIPANNIVSNPIGKPYLVPSYYAKNATVYFSYPNEFNEKREVDGCII